MLELASMVSVRASAVYEPVFISSVLRLFVQHFLPKSL